jgi:hypothetical protein
MANAGTYSDETSTTSGRVTVPVQWTSGASGAVPALSAFAQRYGLTSCTHGATGVYTLVFDDSYVGLLDFSESIIQASYSKNGACKVRITANNIAATAKSIVLLVVDGDGDAVEPASGDVLVLDFALQYLNANA